VRCGTASLRLGPPYRRREKLPEGDLGTGGGGGGGTITSERGLLIRFEEIGYDGFSPPRGGDRRQELCRGRKPGETCRSTSWVSRVRSIVGARVSRSGLDESHGLAGAIKRSDERTGNSSAMV